MPIMFHALDLMRVNAFIIYNQLVGSAENQLEQKEFVLAMVEKLQERAMTKRYATTRSRHEKALKPPAKKRRKQMFSKSPVLPSERLLGPQNAHVQTISKSRSSCKYCSYLSLVFKAQKKEGECPKVSNVFWKCLRCDVHLCSVHFNVYHQPIDDESQESSSVDDEISEMVPA